MVSLLKEFVSGKKRRFKEDGFNLDMTYITERIIAMSFPGSGFESMYRNNISDVSKAIEKRHGKNFIVLNLSGRKYDYEKFHNKVHDFGWEDHHSPPIDLLFNTCWLVHNFLKKDVNNVVFVHCNAGKGRTGTVICCYLYFSGRFLQMQDALQFYKKMRFQQGGGVTQPSQVRYCYYFEKVCNQYLSLNQMLDPAIILLDKLVFNGVPKIASNGIKPYVNVISVKNKATVISTLDPEKKIAPKKFNADTLKEEPAEISFTQGKMIPYIVGDNLFKVYHLGSFNSSLAFRFAFNTAFVPEENGQSGVLRFKLHELDPDSLIKDEKYPLDFSVDLHYKVICRTPEKSSPEFKLLMNYYASERPCWEAVYIILKEYVQPSKKESSTLLFKDADRDTVDAVLNTKKSPQGEDWETIEKGSFNSKESTSGDSGNELNNSYSKEDTNSENSNQFSDHEKNHFSDQENENEIQQ